MTPLVAVPRAVIVTTPEIRMLLPAAPARLVVAADAIVTSTASLTAVVTRVAADAVAVS
jgi:hypothetical protein